jgi:transcriptional regulator
MSLPKSDLPQGTLDLLLLKTLALGPLHGYGIARRLQQLSKSVIQVNQGSLYPALHRLEQRKWLVAEWKPYETGRESKFYRLTRQGRQAMDRQSESWERLTVAIGAVLRQASGDVS